MPTTLRPLRDRLAPFIDAGLIAHIPSAAQIRRAEVEMLPYVVSTDATVSEPYAGTRFGHPLIRQPLIASQVGVDHFRVGLGLKVARRSIITHLHLTYHSGMPVFDLQLLQTHEGGLEALRRETNALIAEATPRAKRLGRLGRLILAKPTAYHRQFLGDDGWIARAARLDYPGPGTESSEFPSEFFSVVDFVNYAATLPNEPLSLTRPSDLLSHLGRRFREGRRLGWFSSRAITQ